MKEHWLAARHVQSNDAGGKLVTIDLAGAGVVRQWRCTAIPPTPEVLRNVRLRIAWDGAAVHSMDVPLGCFIGHAHWALAEYEPERARFDFENSEMQAPVWYPA